MKKYIKIETGSYRGNDMSGRIFPIVKDYQRFSGGKEGGFVTVDCSEFDGFEGLDKARVNVPDIGSLTIVPVQAISPFPTPAIIFLSKIF